MKPKNILLMVIGLIVVAVVAIGLTSTGGGGIENVDAAGVKGAIDAGAQIIDVRTAGEFQMGHIPGAVNVPVDQIQQSAQSWDRDKTYVVYCATGSRSVAAVEIMKGMGFGRIKHFASGIQAWDGQLDKGEASGAKVDTGGKPVLIEFYTDS